MNIEANVPLELAIAREKYRRALINDRQVWRQMVSEKIDSSELKDYKLRSNN